MREAVTTDVTVLQKWPSQKKAQTSAQVAKALGITVFQITARLKAMEGRGFLERNKAGDWTVTAKGVAEAKNPTPVPVKTARIRGEGLPAVGLPDDSKVPHVKIKGTKPSHEVVDHASQRLVEVGKRIKELAKDPKRNRTALAQLRTEESNCDEILKRSRDDSLWVSYSGRDAKIPYTVYVDPKSHKEYVNARSVENADLIIDSKMGPVRLRLKTASIAVRKVEKAEKEQAARKEAKKEDRERVKEALKPEKTNEKRKGGGADKPKPAKVKSPKPAKSKGGANLSYAERLRLAGIE